MTEEEIAMKLAQELADNDYLSPGFLEGGILSAGLSPNGGLEVRTCKGSEFFTCGELRDALQDIAERMQP